MNKIKIYTSDEIICVEKDKQAWINERTAELEAETDIFEEWLEERINPTELFYCSTWGEYQQEMAEIWERWHKKCAEDAEEDFNCEWGEYTVDLDGGNI